MIWFVFVDGLGIGGRDESNPLYVGDFPFFREMFSRNTRYMDPIMGVEGVPQSATGQTAIFTGYNAPKYLGVHKEGFPCSRLGGIIKKESLFRKIMEAGHSPTFANGYITDDLELLARQRFVSVTTLMTMTTEKKVRGLDMLAAGNAVFHDITNETIVNGDVMSGRREKLLKRFGYEIDEALMSAISEITPEKAAENLLRLGKGHDFVLFEFFRTDAAGHLQDMEFALDILSTLERFLKALVRGVDLKRHTFILTSDHGNIEDLSFPGHTHNPVPFTVVGKGEKYVRDVKYLYDITPWIMENIHFLL